MSKQSHGTNIVSDSKSMNGLLAAGKTELLPCVTYGSKRWDPPLCGTVVCVSLCVFGLGRQEIFIVLS